MTTQYQPWYGGGYDPSSPEAKFQQFLAGQTRDVGMKAWPLLDPTLARYQMGLYRDPTQSFRQFLSGYGAPGGALTGPLAQFPSSQGMATPDQPWTRPNLMDDATEAARIADLTGLAFADEYADIPTQGEEQTREDWLGALDQRQRQAVIGRDYLTGQNSAQNQIRWANALLGEQFAGGGTPGMVGQQQLAAPVRRAIGNVMNELYTARLAQDEPGTGFLKWFTGTMGR